MGLSERVLVAASTGLVRACVLGAAALEHCAARRLRCRGAWGYQSAGSSNEATQRAGPRTGVSGASVRDWAIQPCGCPSGRGAGRSDSETGLNRTRP